ncbi:MAG: phospholipase [Rhodobacteraceae bacterium PARR1]|nr:MAG: phospholipase [Rhodobacteraceae bacterium PARR1]
MVILLHGVGAHGSSIAWLADPLGLPTGAAVAAPDAPFAFDPAPQSPGRQWFSVTGVTPENRPARVAAARAPFDAVLAGIIADHGLSDALDRVALVGFSQGSIMALDAVASGRWPVGLLIAFSGRFVGPAPASPPKTPILIAHGTADTAIPVAESYHAHAALPQAEFIVEPGLGHAPGPQGLARAQAMLAAWSGALV